MKKIYFHLPYYPNWYDGANKYQIIVYEYFKKNCEDVYVFGRSIDVKRSKFRLVQVLYKLAHIIGIFIGIIHIARIPKRSILILNNASFFHYTIPLALNKLWKNHEYFLIVHDLVQRERPTFLRIKLENFFITRSNYLITVSNTTLRDLQKLNLVSKDVPVVYPGLDVDFASLPEEKVFPVQTRLLFVGSIEKRKGILYLIDAISQLSEYNFEMNLIGSLKFADYVDVLRKRIKELGLHGKVFLRGRISNDELRSYFLNATIFVFPTLYEGYGMAVAEAMAYGLPIIASKISAITEFVEHGKEGFLVEPANSEEIRYALKTILDDNTLLNEFSKNALLKAKTFSSWDETSKNILGLIEKNF